jgi:hypothetical protein
MLGASTGDLLSRPACGPAKAGDRQTRRARSVQENSVGAANRISTPQGAPGVAFGRKLFR